MVAVVLLVMMEVIWVKTLVIGLMAETMMEGVIMVLAVGWGSAVAVTGGGDGQQ